MNKKALLVILLLCLAIAGLLVAHGMYFAAFMWANTTVYVWTKVREA